MLLLVCVQFISWKIFLNLVTSFRFLRLKYLQDLEKKIRPFQSESAVLEKDAFNLVRGFTWNRMSQKTREEARIKKKNVSRNSEAEAIFG